MSDDYFDGVDDREPVETDGGMADPSLREDWKVRVLCLLASTVTAAVGWGLFDAFVL